MRNVRLQILALVLLAWTVKTCWAEESVEQSGERSSPQAPETQKSKQDLIMQEAHFDVPDTKDETDSATRSGATPVFRKSMKNRQALKLHGTVEEANLTIEWDEWHNKFARAVRSGMFSSFVEALNIPPGTVTWYHCVVNSDRQLKELRITKSSGNFWYDSAVIKAVRKLDGTAILAFPSKSQRLEISTDIGIMLGGPKTGDINFNDVEFRQLAPGEKPYDDEAKPAENGKPGKKKDKQK